MERRLIVGLGNPGPQFERTRHNAGFLLVDRLLNRLEISAQRETEYFLTWTGNYRQTQVALMKPLTYMNLSGRALSAYFLEHVCDPRRMLVAYDDVALPLGRLRMRPSGSSGGQKGMQSIIDTIGSQDFPRLRLGIRTDAYRQEALPDFVLGVFSDAEEAILQPVLDWAVDASLMWMEHELDAVMGKFNSKSAL